MIAISGFLDAALE